ncbi:MAG TPA: 3-deoxy-manno-octulosonate cytidylyltransferase [Gemmatimonadaceae bacterium]|nr:3-deoxy-manno-octulosonate cytidylyltransferase [Gemmatimonadaceae bacterium]
MPILAVIPARLGATRLPRKPLRLLGGAPLIAQVWRRVVALDAIDRCVVATDSVEVRDALAGEGAECEMTAAGHRSGTDRVAEVVAREAYRKYDIVLNVQGDEPFIEEAAVRGAAEIVTSGRFELGTASAPASAQILLTPGVVKVVTADDGRALYFSRAPIPFLRDEADAALQATVVRQHVGVYAYRREALARWVALPEHQLERIERLEQLRPIAAGMHMGVAATADAAPSGVDTEEDLAQANAHWNAFISRRG